MNDYLAEITPLLNKALSHGGRKVQVTLYEQLQQVFRGLETWAPHRGSEEPDLRELQGPLSALAGEMFAREIDVSAEAIRKGRAEAAVGYISLCQGHGMEVYGGLREEMQRWRAGERSGPLQSLLDRGMEKLA